MGANGNFDAFHNLARRYVLGGLSFWDAITEAARLDPGSGIEGFKSSALPPARQGRPPSQRGAGAPA